MTLPSRLQPYEATDALMRSDLEHYCAKLVQIQGKGGAVGPFVWREAQRQLHAKLEKQLDSRGLVRAIVLKARKLGISTYVGARFYHRASLTLGRNAFVLTHQDKSTQELFDLVKLIHEHMPADYQPVTIAANENELAFGDGYNGGYRVGTAQNTSGLGRGMVLQLFHGSEVAFWAAAAKHFAGVLKAVSLVEGTEIVLESTANGVGGAFYDQWVKAEKGQSDYIPIFLPWYVDPDNQRPLEAGYEPSEEELQYQRLYGLTDEQLCWAHYENVDSCGGTPGRFTALFRQENPATSAEAFQSADGETFVPVEAILKARRYKAGDQRHLPRVLGVDVARNLGGGDETRMIDRQGRRAGRIDVTMKTDNTVTIANKIMELLRDNPDIRKAFIDVTGGLGAGPYDICRTNGFEQRVAAVNYGSDATNSERYFNKRAEMWGEMRGWFLDRVGVQIPDDDLWQRQISAPEPVPPDGNSRIKLEPKERIKKRLGFSPDIGDALAQTFAEILPVDMPDERPKWMRDLDDADAGDGDAMTA